jgi:hypothetical protein
MVAPGSLPSLRMSSSPGAELQRQRGRHHESARFHAGDEVRLAGDRGGKLINRRRKAFRVEQQGGDVAEQDARLRVVGNGPDQGTELVGGHATPFIVMPVTKQRTSKDPERMVPGPSFKHELAA